MQTTITTITTIHTRMYRIYIANTLKTKTCKIFPSSFSDHDSVAVTLLTTKEEAK